MVIKGDYISAGPESLASTHLNCIRGLAALAVYISHIRLLFLPAYGTLVAPNALLGGIYLAMRLGHPAVMVFFVLSGYLVGGSVLKDFSAGRWHWGSYLLKRGTRLYVVLIPALALTVLWDSAIGQSLITSIATLTSGRPPGTTIISSAFGAPTLVANLFFLQTILSPPYGSDGPLWSLSWEWWYYLLFPCCLMALTSRRRLAHGALVVLILALVGRHIALYFVIWLMGAGIGLWPISLRKRLTVSPLLFALACMLTVAALVEWKIGSAAAQIGADFGVGVVTTLLIASFIGDSRRSKPGPYQSLSNRMSAISYTLYTVHLPFLLFLRAIFTKGPIQFQIIGVLSLVAIVAVGLLYSFALWWMFEARTDRLRDWIGHALGIVRVSGRLRTTRVRI
jgi:peptidoglycan/LPS O-acetylase OafA/YrhL